MRGSIIALECIGTEDVAVHALVLRGLLVWSGGVSSVRMAGGDDQFAQPLDRVDTVLFLRAETLRLDHQDAVAGDALIAQRQQALLQGVVERRGRDVETQMQCGRDFVDVLATGTLCADRPAIQFFVLQYDVGVICAYGRSLPRRGIRRTNRPSSSSVRV